MCPWCCALSHIAWLWFGVHNEPEMGHETNQTAPMALVCPTLGPSWSRACHGHVIRHQMCGLNTVGKSHERVLHCLSGDIFPLIVFPSSPSWDHLLLLLAALLASPPSPLQIDGNLHATMSAVTHTTWAGNVFWILIMAYKRPSISWVAAISKCKHVQ